MRVEKEAAAQIKKEHGGKRQHSDLSGDGDEDEDDDDDEDEVSVTSIVTPSVKRARMS